MAIQFSRDAEKHVPRAIVKIQLQLPVVIVIGGRSQTCGGQIHTTGNRRDHYRTAFLRERRCGKCSPRPQTSRG